MMDMRPLIALLAAGSLCLAAPARAAGCLDNDSMAAARIHEFEMMLMGVALRCRSVGVDVQASFDRLVAAHKDAFEGADRKLRGYFGAGSSRASQEGYNRYSTVLGNRYGAGSTNLASCTLFNRIAIELGQAAGKVDALIRVAAAMVRDPRIEGARCPAP